MVSSLGSRSGSSSCPDGSSSLGDDGIRDESMDIIYEISKILNTGLDRETLMILVGLCEKGVDPTVLAYVVKHLKEAKRKFLSNLAATKPTA